MALRKPEEIAFNNDDLLLAAVIDSDDNFTNVEVALSILQLALQTKKPMVPHARIGADPGMKLTRAAFAVILKFSNKASEFVEFSDQINNAADNIDTSGSRVTQMKDYLEKNCPKLFKKFAQKWEQASQMRKWTQFIKLQISESLKKRVTMDLQDEIKEQNPSADFKGKLTDEQKAEIEKRFNGQFD